MTERTRFSTAIGLECQGPGAGNYLGEQRNTQRAWYNGSSLEDYAGTTGCAASATWFDGSPGPGAVFDKEACCAPVSLALVECYGGGGGAGQAPVGAPSMPGGGGGAYSSISMALVPGDSFAYNGGAGGATGWPAAAGGDCWFGSTATVLAKGGRGGSTLGPGLGGAASAGVGTVTFSGGNGASQVPGNTGGGGGGCGGDSGNGGNALGVAAGSGNGIGGSGGAGGLSGQPGGFPNNPGGGGGGRGLLGGLSRAGSPGFVRILRAGQPAVFLAGSGTWVVT